MKANILQKDRDGNHPIEKRGYCSYQQSDNGSKNYFPFLLDDNGMV